jgi:hypothetical protein
VEDDHAAHLEQLVEPIEVMAQRKTINDHAAHLEQLVEPLEVMTQRKTIMPRTYRAVGRAARGHDAVEDDHAAHL